MNKLEKLIDGMLKYNTGVAMMDSGGADGRMWQRNQGKDFTAEPAVSFDATGAQTSKEIEYTISAFHYLTKRAGLILDGLCDEYNALECKDWDGFTYGVSEAQTKWLKKRGFEIADKPESFNTYNGESSLSQVLQGTYIKQAGSVDRYLLLQTHNGADVRGGYTDAKLFLLTDEFMAPEDVEGEIDGVSVSNRDDGYSLRNEETGEPVPVKPDSKIYLNLSE